MLNLLEKIKCYIQSGNLLNEGDSILISVSGGRDSCTLLHSMHLLREEFHLQIAAAHFNHGFRGEESDGDEEFVRRLCDQLGVPCHSQKCDLPERMKLTHLSAQETARIARYEYLSHTARTIMASKILLGHTLDDQTETILLNIIRGTGVEGLKGMLPSRNGMVRPLLCLTREETGKYCEATGIAYRTDRSNASVKYMRNRIRLELLPLLRKEYNPCIDQSLRRLGDIAYEESKFIDDWVNEIASRVLHSVSDGVVFMVEDLLSQPLALRRRLIRHAIEMIQGSDENVTFDQIQSFLDEMTISRNGVTWEETLQGGRVRLRLSNGKGSIRHLSPQVSVLPFEYQLNIPGVTPITAVNAELECRYSNQFEMIRSSNPYMAWMDVDKLSFPLILRNRRSGDRFIPLGMQEPVKLKDYLIGKKVPKGQKDLIAIISDANGIVWVAGYTINDRVKITDDTRTCMICEMRYLVKSV